MKSLGVGDTPGVVRISAATAIRDLVDELAGWSTSLDMDLEHCRARGFHRLGADLERLRKRVRSAEEVGREALLVLDGDRPRRAECNKGHL
jgi:hypothetical protein